MTKRRLRPGDPGYYQAIGRKGGRARAKLPREKLREIAMLGVRRRQEIAEAGKRAMEEIALRRHGQR